MIYRILQVGSKWQAQVKGAHNWIPLQDGNGDDLLHDTERQAQCAMQKRILQFSAGPYHHKQKQFVATEAK